MEAGTVTFDAGYTMGLQTVDDSSYDYDMKNGVISIVAGLSF